LQLEKEEATRLLQQQRALVTGLDSESSPFDDANECPDLPETLVSHYRELLRAFVIMGSGNFGEEMTRLAHLLALANVTARQAMLLHLYVLEEMVNGLGSRSARHVMSRADLLILEMIINLSDGYRERLIDRVHPPKQLLLPGFDNTLDSRFAA